MNRKLPANAKPLLILAIALFLSSCKSNSQSVVFSDECAIPCWRGITPGETHFQDAVNAVKKFPDYESKRSGISDKWNIFSNFIGFYLKTGEDIRVYAIDDVVAVISFSNTRGITFKNFAEEFGDPKYVARSTAMGRGPLWSESPHVWLTAISPEKGVAYNYDTAGNLRLTHNRIVVFIDFFDVNLYEKLLNDYFFMGEEQVELYDWKGYGNIDELYPVK
ncbi:MAG: hypothetical protein AB1750_02700 [Chloroflexota bacterium]